MEQKPCQVCSAPHKMRQMAGITRLLLPRFIPSHTPARQKARPPCDILSALPGLLRKETTQTARVVRVWATWARRPAVAPRKATASRHRGWILTARLGIEQGEDNPRGHVDVRDVRTGGPSAGRQYSRSSGLTIFHYPTFLHFLIRETRKSRSAFRRSQKAVNLSVSTQARGRIERAVVLPL